MKLSYQLLSEFSFCEARHFLTDIKKLPKRASYWLIVGDACHSIVAGFHPTHYASKTVEPKYINLKEALEDFEDVWTELLHINRGYIENESDAKTEAFKKRSIESIKRYAERNLKQGSKHPLENKKHTTIIKEGNALTVKFDQIRELEFRLIRKLRNDVFTGRKMMKGFSRQLIIDLKFSDRKKPFVGKQLTDRVIRVSREDLTEGEQKSSAVLDAAFRNTYNVAPLGVGFYYPYDGVMAFTVPDEGEFSAVIKDIKRMNFSMANDQWNRRPDSERCSDCELLPDCRGYNEEYVDIPVQNLEVVKKGIPTWVIESGAPIEGLQMGFIG